MMKKGAFIFVLHSHLPYVRKKGKWPHGEDMLFEAMSETYIPILNALNELLDEGYHPRLTISLTPILLEQLADKYLNKEFIAYLDARIKASEKDIRIYSRSTLIKDPEDRRKHLEIAEMYLAYYTKALYSFKTFYKKNLVNGFKDLQDKGVLDIITSSATHAYLPLFHDENSINEQLKVGIMTYKKYLGVYPRGIWLPECGYRPLVRDASGMKVSSGFEEYLEHFNLQYFFTDSHAFSSSMHIHSKETVFIGPYDYRHVQIEDIPEEEIIEEKPTYRPYTVSSSHVAVFARDINTSLQVWSGDFGYPGDYFYREFHAKDSISGLRYCRITHHNGLGNKEIYDAAMAKGKVQEHADHFTHLVESRVNEVYEQTKSYCSIVSSYDTELYGHWWFEGVDWLKEVLKRIEKSESVELSTADGYMHVHPPEEKIAIPESSWGLGGGHHIWMNDDTEWMWPIIHDLSAKIKQASLDFPNARGMKKTILNQALRELLLLHSSDWPFLISTVQAKDYAIERFMSHKDNCEKLLALAYEKKRYEVEDKAYVRHITEVNNPFADLDYTKFGQEVELE